MESRIALSLRAKFIIPIIGIILLLGAVTTIFVHSTLTSTLTRELQERGTVISKNLAANSIDAILTDNVVELRRLIFDAKEAEKDIAYVYILDSKKDIIVHTFEDGFPKALLELHSSGDIRLLETEEGFIRSIATPVLDGKAGFVYVGISESSIREKIADITKTLFILTFIAIGAGILLAYFTVNLITKPIYVLTKGAEEIGKGNFDTRINISTEDEVAILADAFNKMIIELKKSMVRLIQSEKLASIGMLAAGVAHEINNPLTNILLSAESLLRKRTDENTLKQKLEEIISEVEHARIITRNLSEFSRQVEPEIKEMDIKEILERILGIIRIKNIRVERDIQSVILEGDPSQLQQVFLNIIINAVQAMPKGGRLSVSAGEANGFVEVSISDTGVGIPEESLGKIFDPFFTTKKVGEGTGLGLSICLGIVEKHEGEIKVNSKVGEGSTFTVRLPVDRYGKHSDS
ncbi:histidine kinase,HAMP domain-containing protein,histidine kinase [Candidatus Methanoperedens nitroreducens]|uniref:histidine kinase n=1 Tax=Candidatus Methanoperedens nitratireducens TaxID=1392998 RepID=A0A062VCB3_9EURY|nr:ATP-binding protein [Candidatus Methanoperedens nitroreducens]KCZ73334.1 histidine kinase,HAMP domain-containing protein,histidine kinase [Candidatus Methanoperedens nitroreducens]MDJ1422718.1 ATP-binding protein [Candidatus Methanoperedens sp.]